MSRKLFLLAALFLCACTNARIEDYADRTPKMDLREYYNGNVEAWGVFIDSKGMVTQTFHVDLKCSWNGDDGVFDEHFIYDDGHTQNRIWKPHFVDEHHFTATANDVVGTARGAQYGNAINMSYVLRLPVGDTTYDVTMDDWMYRMDETTMINRTIMSKLGVKVGEILITFKKLPSASGKKHESTHG